MCPAKESYYAPVPMCAHAAVHRQPSWLSPLLFQHAHAPDTYVQPLFTWDENYLTFKSPPLDAGAAVRGGHSARDVGARGWSARARDRLGARVNNGWCWWWHKDVRARRLSIDHMHYTTVQPSAQALKRTKHNRKVEHSCSWRLLLPPPSNVRRQLHQSPAISGLREMLERAFSKRNKYICQRPSRHVEWRGQYLMSDRWPRCAAFGG